MIAQPPLVSVILPTLNRSLLLRRAVASVLGQSHANLELLVVDDGSSEDISAVVESFGDPRASVIRHRVNQGVSAARNTGVAAARGEYLAFQDSDDEWRCGKLALQVAQLQARPEVDLSLCALLRVRRDGGLWQYPGRSLMTAYGKNFRQAVYMNAFAFTQTWLVRRRCLEAAGGFDTALHVWEDWDMLLRIRRLASVALLPDPLVISHATAGSLGADIRQRVHALQHMLQSGHHHSDRQLLARLNYLLVRYKLLEGQRADLWAGVLTALRLDASALKSWLLAGMLLFGPWLPAKYFQSRQPGY